MVDTLLGIVIENLRSLVLEKLRHFWTLVNLLRRNFAAIFAALSDAEEKQITSLAVKDWSFFFQEQQVWNDMKLFCEHPFLSPSFFSIFHFSFLSYLFIFVIIIIIIIIIIKKGFSPNKKKRNGKQVT